MDEKKKDNAEEKKPVKAPKNALERIQQQATEELDRAEQINERTKLENDRREELIVREEALQARRMVGGVADAGQIAPKEKPLTDIEVAEKVMAGEFDPLKADGFV